MNERVFIEPLFFVVLGPRSWCHICPWGYHHNFDGCWHKITLGSQVSPKKVGVRGETNNSMVPPVASFQTVSKWRWRDLLREALTCPSLVSRMRTQSWIRTGVADVYNVVPLPCFMYPVQCYSLLLHLVLMFTSLASVWPLLGLLACFSEMSVDFARASQPEWHVAFTRSAAPHFISIPNVYKARR